MKKLYIMIISMLLLMTVISSITFAQTTIRYANWPTHEEEEVEREVIAKFEEQNPDIKIKFEPAPYGDYAQKLIVQLSAGNAPDVFNILSLAEWAEFQVLAPLDELTINSSYTLNDFFPAVIASSRYNGNTTGDGDLYGIPINAGGFVLYYNKKLFDEYGLEYPDETWTYDKLIEVGKEFVEDLDGDGNYDQFGLVYQNMWDKSFIDIILRGHGGKLWSDDRKECLAGTPESMEGIQFISDTANKYHVAPLFSETSDSIAFENGNIAMVIHHTYINSIYRERANFDWDITMIPAGPEGFQKTPAWGHVIGINARSKKKEAAWEFIQYLASQEAQKYRLSELSIVPSRKSVFESDVFKDIKVPSNMGIIYDVLDNAYVYRRFPTEQEAFNVFHSYYDRIVLGNEDPARIIPRIISNINDKLN